MLCFSVQHCFYDQYYPTYAACFLLYFDSKLLKILYLNQILILDGMTVSVSQLPVKQVPTALHGNSEI